MEYEPETMLVEYEPEVETETERGYFEAVVMTITPEFVESVMAELEGN